MPRKKLTEDDFVSNKAAPKGLDLQVINTRLPRRLYKAVKLACVENEITITTFMIEAATEKLKSMPRPYL